MFTSIPSLDSVVQCLLPVFTQPSFQTHVEVLLGWMMCLGKRTEYGVFQTIRADTPVSRQQRHPFDRFYNFFSRSAWMVRDLAHQVAVAVMRSDAAIYDPTPAKQPKSQRRTQVAGCLRRRRRVGVSASGTRNGCLLICSAFSARRSSKLQLTPSRPQRLTCTNYLTNWKTT